MRNGLAALAALVLISSNLWSQEVSVDEPVLVPLAKYPADQVATFVTKTAPEYPAAWLADQRPRYATVGFLLDPKGVPSRIDVDSDREEAPILRKLAATWRFHPMLLRGKAVTAGGRVVIRFNPTSASDPAANTPIRILSVSLPPSLAAMDGFGGALYFRANLQVDATGQAQAIEVVPNLNPRLTDAKIIAAHRDPEVLAAVKAMLQRWRFAPARQNGQPIASPLTLTVWTPNERYLDYVDAIPTKRVNPIYPESLRESGNRGEVQILFTIDATGTPRDPSVIKSSHPAFEAPAVAALLQWRFTPARLAGNPVSSRTILPIVFSLSGGFTPSPLSMGPPPEGVETFQVSGGAGKRMPPQFRYDTAPKPKLMVMPVYPFELLKKSTTGTAEVVMLVSSTGWVLRTKAKQASTPEFGKAAEAAALCWAFEPALLTGKPTETVLSHEFNFDKYDRDFALDDDAVALLQKIRKESAKITRLKELDHIPAATYRIRPVYAPEAPSGTVLVEFYLDQHGKVRFPHAISSTDDSLVYPALTAMARWQFEPPLQHGKPVDAVAQIPLKYTAQPPPKPQPGS